MTSPSDADLEKLKKIKVLQNELGSAFEESKKYTGDQAYDPEVFKKIEGILKEIAELTAPEESKP